MMKNRAQDGLSAEKGVSLLEVLIVVAIILVVSAVSIINISGSLKVAAADSAAQLVQQDMRLARQSAISKRLVYRLTFNAPGTIIMDQLLTTTTIVSGVPTVNTTVTNVLTDSLPGTVTFNKDSGAPIDYDSFGDGVAAIYFNGSNQIYFQPDGAGRDATGKICNGVVYSEISGQMLSSRSITLWGSTGQIKLYKLYAGGTAGHYWK